MAYSESSIGHSINSVPGASSFYADIYKSGSSGSRRSTDIMNRSISLLGRIIFRLRGGKNKPNYVHVDDHIAEEFIGEEGMGSRRYRYDELWRATEGFSQKREIGRGGSGVVYKGVLEERGSNNREASRMMEVAVKVIKWEDERLETEYISEIMVLGRLRHTNLVRLLGWCHEGNQLLLVHEFVSNGSLHSHLHDQSGQRPPLPWEVRYWKIALGLASALLYLQEGWERCVVHRDIKPSNILLDSDFNPKLTDFELARLADDRDSELDITNVVAGTMGYLAPEFIFTGKFSKESDIFAFGVVALQIACGRRPSYKSSSRRSSFLEWLQKLYDKGEILEAADPLLGDAFNRKEMERLMIVGLWCTRYDPKTRPSIAQVINLINFQKKDQVPRTLFNKKQRYDIKSSDILTAGRLDVAQVEVDDLPPTQQGMMPHFLNDVDDLQTICFELVAAESADTSTQTNVVATTGTSSDESANNGARSIGNQRTADSDQENEGEGVQLPSIVQGGDEAETSWDIGIPPNYDSVAVGPVKDHHHPVMKGFVASLEKILHSENEPPQLNEVLDSIRIYTRCLVSVNAPLLHWNSLAQLVLRAVQEMNLFFSSVDPKPATAGTLSSLRANMSECNRTIDEDGVKLDNIEKQLALAQQERSTLMAKLAELEKQIEEAEDEVKIIDRTRARNLENCRRQHAILNLFESALSQLSSFTCKL